jgi:cell division protease FtsH
MSDSPTPSNNEPKKPDEKTTWLKNAAVALAVFIGIVSVSYFMGMKTGVVSAKPATEIAFSELLNLVDQHKVSAVAITGANEDELNIELANHAIVKSLSSMKANELTKYIHEKDPQIKTTKNAPEAYGYWLGYLLQFAPFLLIIAMVTMGLRKMQNNMGGGAMGFGRSRAKLLDEKLGTVTFADVAGIDEAQEELEEIVDFLKDPKKFSRLGGKIPRGVLLVGSPGTGKTLLARAIAGEAKVPFFSISGSDFVEMFVGVGASRVRDMFEQAKRSAPCIIFIDEIDAVGRHRGVGLGNSNDEREQTLNQLLVEMDGFSENEGIIIIAATNRPDVLDPALLRPGRFDRQVVVPHPDIDGREKILAVHMKRIPLAPDVEARVIARGTPGFSGADLANLVNEAALLAARRSKRLVAMKELEDAKDKVMMGAERRSMVMTEDEKKMTAYHEAGHAIVAINEPASDPIHKATVIPRGNALGMVMRLPEKDSYSFHRDQMHANLSVSMGGRVAEELIYGHDKVSSGASGDIQGATKLARHMVTKWGMSKDVGPLDYGTSDENYLGLSSGRSFPIADETAVLIDKEVKKLVEDAHKRATMILKKHIKVLHAVAQALIELETLTGDEIKAIAEGKEIIRDRENKNILTLKPLRAGGASVPQSGEYSDNDNPQEEMSTGAIA